MISLETTGALNAIWCCAQQLVPDILCTVWFGKLYLSLLEIKSGENINKEKRGKTHRGFVSEEFLYDFYQLVFLFRIQTERREE